VAHKIVSKQTAMDFLRDWKSAASSLVDRSTKLSQAAVAMEKDMTLLGITAIEDRLQDQVPEVIADIIKAGITDWMLTGDKEETPVNIGRSCNLLEDDTHLFYITGQKSAEGFDSKLLQIYEALSAGFVRGEGYSSADSAAAYKAGGGRSCHGRTELQAFRRSKCRPEPPPTNDWAVLSISRRLSAYASAEANAGGSGEEWDYSQSCDSRNRRWRQRCLHDS